MTQASSTNSLRIRDRVAIGPECDAYVMAEIGTNHNRSLATARALVEGAARAGCDCAKFQVYEPDELVSGRIRAADYGLDAIYGDISAQDMFERHLKTPKEWFPELLHLCHDLGLDCAATIHGANGLAWANDVGLDVVKIASMDHTNLPFLRSLVSAVDAPILVSVGMATLADVDSAVDAIRGHRPGIGLFHCCAVYPPEPHELRLLNIPFLLRRFECPIGFSDHALGSDAAVEARRLGAMMFEKHITLDHTQAGPDHGFAIEMTPLREYVAAIKGTRPRPAASASFADPLEREMANRRHWVKSVITRRSLAAGHVVRDEDVYLARPGSGIAPDQLPQVIGRTLARAVAGETPLHWDDLEPT